MDKIMLWGLVLVLLSSMTVAQVCPFATTEGNLLRINAEGYDPDPEIGPAGQLIWTYPAPFDSSGVWQTRVGDAGVYRLEFGLSDGEYTDTMSACLEVFPRFSPVPHATKIEEYNNPPMLFGLKDAKMFVGQTLNLHITCIDIDGDNVDITYYGWPGELVHEATLAEVGSHAAEIVCRDSRGAETRQTVNYLVMSRSSEPVIILDKIVVYEGEVVDLTAYVYDLDTPSEDLRFEGTGIFKNSLKWYTQKGDAGNYSTILSVSDGQTLVSKHIAIEVLPYVDDEIVMRYSDLPAFKEDIIEVEQQVCEPCICSSCDDIVIGKEPDYPIELVKEPDYPIELRMPKEKDPCSCEEEQKIIKEPVFVVQKEPDYPVEVVVQTENLWSSADKNPCKTTNYII